MASFLAKLFGRPKGLSRYEIQNVIARGGMSVVYKARNRETGDILAVKILNPETIEVADRIQRAFESKSEGEVALALHHPHVVRTFEFGTDGKKYFIAMEYVAGPNLKQMIVHRDAAVREHRLGLLVQTGQGLGYLHNHGLVHRDFCPKNILVSGESDPKIIDFGLSIPKSRKQKWRWDRSGTPSYMAPEQIRGQEVDVRSDIYAFGVTMFEVLTGKMPFKEGRTRFGKMQPHLNVDPIEPSHFDKNIPKALDAVVLKAMSKDRLRRHQTMDELLRDVHEATAETGAELPPLE